MNKDDPQSTQRKTSGDNPAQEPTRDDVSRAAGAADAAGQTAQRTATRVMGGVESFAHDAVSLTGSLAGDGVHMVRDVASDAVQAVGEVGGVAVRTASDLLVDLVQGLRDVAESVTRRSPPPQPPAG